MACLESADILKRDNLNVLLDIVQRGESLTVGSRGEGESIPLMSKIRLCGIIYHVTPHTRALAYARLREHCETIKGSPPEVCAAGIWKRITCFCKDARFVPKNTIKGAPAIKDKLFQQRQEIDLVAAINVKPMMIPNFEYRIMRAEQAPDIGPHGKENLVDVMVYDEKQRVFNVSCKQDSAADLGGGGMTGLIKTVPGLITNLYSTVIKDLTSFGFKEAVSYNINEIPQFQYKIPDTFTYKIFRGSEQIGGVIDYMYIGPSTVVLTEDRMNGLFIPVEQYARKSNYYFRLRKRDVYNNTVTINYRKFNANGYPVIFTSGPMHSPAARFVVEDRVLKTSIVREIDESDCGAS